MRSVFSIILQPALDAESVSGSEGVGGEEEEDGLNQSPNETLIEYIFGNAI